MSHAISIPSLGTMALPEFSSSRRHCFGANSDLRLSDLRSSGILKRNMAILDEMRDENTRLRSVLERLRADVYMLEHDHRQFSLLGIHSNLSSSSRSTCGSGSSLSQFRYFMDTYQNKTVLGIRQMGLSRRSYNETKERESILNHIRQARYSLARENKLLAKNYNQCRAGETETTITKLIEKKTENLNCLKQRDNKHNVRLGSIDNIDAIDNMRGLGEAIVVDSSRASIHHLPRGAVYVQTSKCAVQFGIPPETIKDSLALGLSVPTYFVVPEERFNLKLGINMCEVEFPAYFNFFLRNLSVSLIVKPEIEELIRNVVDEVLEGPIKEHLYVDTEYPDETPSSGRFSFAGRPNHQKEIKFFKEPRDGNEINTNSLVKFIHFNSNSSDSLEKVCESESSRAKKRSLGSKRKKIGNFQTTNEILVADLGNGIVIEDNGSEYVVYDDSIKVATVPHFLSSWAPIEPSFRHTVPETIVDPPDFGVTVLGSSHGFDKSGSTSGFVLWINKKGLMVDPPPNATAILMRYGIAPSMVTGVILTHCHADHDAGTFQKILKEGRITLYTTKTIFNSFIRKYAIISGFTEDFLIRLFEHRLVKIGENVHWGGGTLRFFYSLHALPCIGFEAKLDGKTFVYSADTYYDPEGLKVLRDKGYLSPARFEGLMDFPFHYDLCIHEAGIPPIHTPYSVLEQLPESKKKNLYIIHITEECADKSGLRLARSGVEHTITIPTRQKRYSAATKLMNLLQTSDLFRSFTMANVIDLLRLCDERTFQPGEVICRKGDTSNDLYLITSGFCAVDLSENGATDTTDIRLPDNWRERNDLKIFGSGDHVGERGLIGGSSRSANIFSLTTVKLLILNRKAFAYFQETSPMFLRRMLELSNIRQDLSWKAIDKNSVFSRLASSQRSQLQVILKHCKVEAGRVLWKRNRPVTRAYLISSGELEFLEIRNQIGSPFVQGAFLCDLRSMLSQRNVVPVIEVMRDSTGSHSTSGKDDFGLGNGKGRRPRSGRFSNLSLNSQRVERVSGIFSTSSRGKFKGTSNRKRMHTLTSRLTLSAKTDCELYYIESEDLLEYLEYNPGIFVNLVDSILLE